MSVRYALVAAVALLLLACSGNAEPAERTPRSVLPTPEPTWTPDPARSIRIIALERTVSAENANVTVHGFREVPEARGVAAPEGYQWVIFDLSVANEGDEAFHLFYALVDDQRMEPFDTAPDLFEGFEVAPVIQPGGSIRGELGFVVPAGEFAHMFLFGPGEAYWAIQLGMFRGGG